MLDWESTVPPAGDAYVIRWFGDHWLAFGAQGASAAVWSSTDGLNWTKSAPILPAGSHDIDHMSGYWINDIIRLDDGYLAVGWNRIGCCDGGRGVTWTSPDGINWTFHDPTGTPFADYYHGPWQLDRLPNGGILLLSWTGLGGGSMLWTTLDGRNWTEVPTEWDEFPVSAMAASPEMVMLIGQQWSGGLPETLVSHDGYTWSKVAAPPGAGNVNDLVYDEVNEQFVAVGNDTSERPMVWLSADGHSWATTRLDGHRGTVRSVAAAGGLVAMSGTSYDNPSAIVWASRDGITWSVNDLGGDSGTTGVGNGRVLLWQTDLDYTDDEVTPRIWLGRLR